MGLICGQWAFEGTAGAAEPRSFPRGIRDVARTGAIFSDQGVRLAVRGSAAVKPMRRSSTPADGEANSMLVWDGRLDNASDLARELGPPLTAESGDTEIVATAYECWGTAAFGRIKGDWALAIWNADERCLVLAKDPIGTHPLFYSRAPRSLSWSNSLAWLVQNSDAHLELDFEYVAGWLAFFPAAHLTPFSSIAAVPPSCFVRCLAERTVIQKFWDFEQVEPLCYQSDFEFEERFRMEFTSSVRRRLRSTQPVLAQLSGGMDSSSIVCVADALLKHEGGLAPRLDTLSYYDDGEPNWDEKPYFTLVEAQRGREGFHVPVESSQYLAPLFEHQSLAVIPADLGKASEREERIAQFMRSQNYGSVLSGIGGDEFTGGVPTPIPELADLLAEGRARPFAKQLMRWALSQRRPWIHVLFDTLGSFAPSYLGRSALQANPPSWLISQFRGRYRSVLRGYDKPLTLWGTRPSFQENLSALEALRRQLGALNAGSEETTEKRFPYLDSDFLQFLFSVPRQQLLEPGRRRSLMRRSLAGIVPGEILHRKRKAYVTRAPRTAIAAHWLDIQSLTNRMVAESLGIVSAAAFRQTLNDIRNGKELPIVPIHRTLLLECWLRNLSQWGVLPQGRSPQERQFARPGVAATA